MNTPHHKACDLLQLLKPWRQSGAMPACLSCGSSKFEIKDLSARPHTEWYRFSCPDCGLNETVAVPQATPGQSGIT